MKDGSDDDDGGLLPGALLQPVHVELHVVERDVEEEGLLVRRGVRVERAAVVEEPRSAEAEAVRVERALERVEVGGGGEREEGCAGGGDGVDVDRGEHGARLAEVDARVLDEREGLGVPFGGRVAVREVQTPVCAGYGSAFRARGRRRGGLPLTCGCS